MSWPASAARWAVFTLGGPGAVVEAAARVLAADAVARLDLGSHAGEHPRFGVVDVVPFVPLDRAGVARASLGLEPAVAARDRFAAWAGTELDLPCFCYGPRAGGPDRTLPEIRRDAFSRLAPSTGPAAPHPTAGACAVGARHPLVAYNLTVAGGDVARARRVAHAVRGPSVRALGFDLGGTPQVSANLLDPERIGPAQFYDQVAEHLAGAGAEVARAELVGLVPEVVLEAVPRRRWAELDLDDDRTIERRLAARGLIRRR
jgi:glutamate formiminotransferase